MLKSLALICLLLNLNQDIPKRDISYKKYIVFGSNSIQKVYYASSSVYSKSNEGKKAMDSDKKSCWISGKNGAHWLEIDFGTKRIMSKIIVYPGQKDKENTIKYFKLQFLYKEQWFDYATVQLEQIKTYHLFSTYALTFGNYLDKAEIELGGIDCSTFRIYIPEGATYNGFASIAEVETYVGKNRLKYFDERLIGMCFPIKNGYLPVNDSSYPNAPRTYRGGKHVGLDIYTYYTEESYEPLPVTKETEVLAMDDGVVIRADLDYKPMTANEWRYQSEYFQRNPRTFVKRSFGGIQVWIDHGNGVVSTYNHLSKIDKGLKKGSKVSKGEVIGYVGNSGLLGEALGTDQGVHLHFEIWIDGHYLGYGMQIKDIREYFSWIFSIHH